MNVICKAIQRYSNGVNLRSNNFASRTCFGKADPNLLSNLIKQNAANPLRQRPLIRNFYSFNTLFASKGLPPGLKPISDVTIPEGKDIFSKTLKEMETKQQVATAKKKGKIGRRVRAPDEAWCIVKAIPGSIKKTKLVANLISGLTYKDAVIQLKLCRRKIARILLKGLESARANAENNHKLDPFRCVVAEAIINKDYVYNRVRYHSKGRAGLMQRRFSRVTIILKELPEGDERLFFKNTIKEDAIPTKTGSLETKRKRKQTRSRTKIFIRTRFNFRSNLDMISRSRVEYSIIYCLTNLHCFQISYTTIIYIYTHLQMYSM